MRRLIVLVAACLAVPVAAHAGASTETVSFEGLVTACNGDTIKISGSLLFVFNETSTPSGGLVFSFQTQPQGVTGVDLQTGATYRGTGVTRQTSVSRPAGGFTETFVNQFRIQATAGGQSYIVSQTFHVTVDADGGVTVVVDRVSTSC